ncbi:MAG: hypothetical protein ABJB61_01750 [bacterium]
MLRADADVDVAGCASPHMFEVEAQASTKIKQPARMIGMLLDSPWWSNP